MNKETNSQVISKLRETKKQLAKEFDRDFKTIYEDSKDPIKIQEKRIQKYREVEKENLKKDLGL